MGEFELDEEDKHFKMPACKLLSFKCKSGAKGVSLSQAVDLDKKVDKEKVVTYA